MTATQQCPSCGGRQDLGLLCSACCDRLERDLRAVPAIVADLDITLSKMAKLLEATGSGSLAREREAMHLGAMRAGQHLNAILTGWARDVSSEEWRPARIATQTVEAAGFLLGSITAIRRHPAVKDLAEGIGDANHKARAAYDRPINRTIIYVGPCPEQAADGDDCPGHVYAYIPVEDDKPGRMECDVEAEHKYTSIQWYRAGKRILDRINERKRSVA